MENSCLKLLRVIFEKETSRQTGIRLLLQWIDRFHWADFMYQRDQIDNYLDYLVANQYVIPRETAGPGGKIQMDYVVTQLGKDYLAENQVISM